MRVVVSGCVTLVQVLPNVQARGCPARKRSTTTKPGLPGWRSTAFSRLLNADIFEVVGVNLGCELLGHLSFEKLKRRCEQSYRVTLTFAKIGSRPILGLSVVNVTQVGEGHGADVGFCGRFDSSIASRAGRAPNGSSSAWPRWHEWRRCKELD
jgi:hypothetical protein